MTEENIKDTQAQEQHEEDVARFQELIEKSTPLVQAIATAAETANPGEYFKNYQALMKMWTPENLREDGHIPPWNLPIEFQTVLLHSGFNMIVRLMSKLGMFKALQMMEAQGGPSSILAADGRPAFKPN